MQFFTTVLAATAGLLFTADACLRVTAKHVATDDRVYNFSMIDNNVFMCNGAFIPSFFNLPGVLPLSCAIDTNWVANLVKVGKTIDEGLRVEVLDRAGPRRFKFSLVFSCVEWAVDGQVCKVASLTANEYGC